MVESPNKEETAQKPAADEETPTTDNTVTQHAADNNAAAAADPSAARKRRKAIIESQRKESEESAAAAAAAQQKETENEGASKTANSSVTGSDDGHTAHEDHHSEGESVTKKRKTKRTQIRYDPDVPMSKEQLAAWRREARRVRNRESAAASRQRIRNRITELETEVDEYKSKYHAALERLKELEHQQANQNGAADGTAPLPQAAAEGKMAESS